MSEMAVRPVIVFGGLALIGLLGCYSLLVAAEEKAVVPEDAVFEMHEASAFDPHDKDMQRQLVRGMYVMCSNEPDKNVKAYPKLNSKQPIYGVFKFDRTEKGWGGVIPFVIDESGEPARVEAKSTAENTDKKQEDQAATKPGEKSAEKSGQGSSPLQGFLDSISKEEKKPAPEKTPLEKSPWSTYDRLYVDLNQDGDLTNDPVVMPMKNPPMQMLPQHWAVQGKMAFDFIDIPTNFDAESGGHPFRIFPWLTIANRDGKCYQVMHVVPTEIREGKMQIGKDIYQVALLRSSSHRFDRASVILTRPLNPQKRMDAKRISFELLQKMWQSDGVLYTIAATPLGNQLTVKPYRGDFGILRIEDGGRGIEEISFNGEVYSDSLQYSLDWDPMAKDPKQEFRREYHVPVGDYRPDYSRFHYGTLHFTVSDNYHSDGCPRDQDGAHIDFIKIRKDQPFVLDFRNKPEVLFATPGKDKSFKLGEQVQVNAVLIDPICNIMIRRIVDTSQKKKETIKNNGKEEVIERETQLDPVVTITDSAGKTVAEGPMPFG
jgi:hypothetical protein